MVRGIWTKEGEDREYSESYVYARWIKGLFLMAFEWYMETIRLHARVASRRLSRVCSRPPLAFLIHHQSQLLACIVFILMDYRLWNSTISFAFFEGPSEHGEWKNVLLCSHPFLNVRLFSVRSFTLSEYIFCLFQKHFWLMCSGVSFFRDRKLSAEILWWWGSVCEFDWASKKILSLVFLLAWNSMKTFGFAQTGNSIF